MRLESACIWAIPQFAQMSKYGVYHFRPSHLARWPDSSLFLQKHIFRSGWKGEVPDFELLRLLGLQPRLLVEGRPSAHQPSVLLDIPSHRVDAPLIPLDLEQLLQLDTVPNSVSREE